MRAARGLEGHQARAGQLRPRPALDQVGRSHEVGDERVAGQVVDLGRGAGLLDRPVAHDHDAVGDREGLLQVVGDVHRGDAERALQLLDLEPHLGAQLRVQVAEGLVEEQHRRPEHEGAREGHPLLLAARELRGAAGGRARASARGRAPRRPAPRSPPPASSAPAGRRPRCRTRSCGARSRRTGTPSRGRAARAARGRAGRTRRPAGRRSGSRPTRAARARRWPGAWWSCRSPTGRAGSRARPRPPRTRSRAPR